MGELEFQRNIERVALVVGILGVMLNLCLAAVTQLRKSGSIDWLLILFISILDLVCSLFLVVRVLFLWFDEASASKALLCGFGSIAVMAAMLVTLFLSAALGLVRYLVIVRGVTVTSISLYPPLLLVSGIVFLLHAVRGMTSDIVTFPSKLYCIVNYFGDDAFSKLFGVVNVTVFGSSMVTIMVCYSIISCDYFSLLNRYGHRGYRLYAPVIGLLVVALMYSAAMLPETSIFLYLLLTEEKRTIEMDVLSILPVSCLPIVNAMYTFLLHDETRYKLISLFTRHRHSDPPNYPNYSR